MKFKIKWTELTKEYWEAEVEAESEQEAIDLLGEHGMSIDGNLVWSECLEDGNSFDNSDYTIEVVA